MFVVVVVVVAMLRGEFDKMKKEPRVTAPIY
jgi:hypothetical protein